ncbi:MAG: hypothetical protein OFPI_32040 [Osedax symbiont Rs2]|nr:MAG: hypothetical protein OFPI_32040 [Osedax symbiont Rs2]
MYQEMRTKSKKQIVFVVEDNDAYRVLLGRMLEQRGFLVLMFENGFKALSMLEYLIPCIILSDIQMPGMDGFELREEIDSMYPKLRIPFQYISSTNEQVLIEKANELSILELVQKPARAEELSEVLKTGIKKFAAA